ncbi:uncharacterized protein LOC8272053 [Ricinus communis]|uniref:Uncharacterized protein n=1 Tax=Ricinus communis TaxID=3988 RepID=B9S435_RICCO|nr:uncharacterized protein LOC8272053 [Ricinus communis]EEF41716.1 conserved hypothetical protein [Ricinus communis]|eukprot:XP_002520754.1 uncharacterized protein LOC8272053 [Ricinus communis]
MAGIEEGEVGFEEGMSCLPSHVLHEAIWETKEYYGQSQQHHHQQYRHLPQLPLQPQQQQLRSKSNPRAHSRTRHPTNGASGGSGMRAIFLDSGKQTCGTGVFLPRRAGTNLPFSKKPACSPVLLPARVVQALNLNIHETGLQISRRKDASRSGDCNLIKNRTGKDGSAQCCVVSQNENSSPEILLPKEWTY